MHLSFSRLLQSQIVQLLVSDGYWTFAIASAFVSRVFESHEQLQTPNGEILAKQHERQHI